VPRLAGLTVPQSIASGFEIGIHNSTLAIAVALTVLESTAMAIPSAIHGIVMFPIAAACDAREGVMAEVNAAPATPVSASGTRPTRSRRGMTRCPTAT